MNQYKSSKFSKISNLCFLIISIFSLFFLWCNYYINNINISIISSIIFIIAFLIIYAPIKIYTNKKISASNKKSLKKDAIIEHLKLSSEQECYNLITNLSNLQSATVLSYSHLILDNTDIFIDFSSPEANTINIEKFIKQRLTSNINIYCINKPSLINKINNININFIEINDILRIMEEKDIEILQLYKYEKIHKPNLNTLLFTIFNKEKSRSYFVYGFILLFFSLLTPYSIFYIIMSSILIILSIICKFELIKKISGKP